MIRRAAPLLMVASAAALFACAGNYRRDKSFDSDRAAREVLRLRWHKRLVVQGSLSFKPQEWASAAFGPAGTIFIGTSGKVFHAFSSQGEELWRVETDGAVSAQPLFAPATQTVYFGADDGRIYAVDALSGKLRWKYSTKGVIAHAPSLSGGVLMFTTNENRIYGLDAVSGRWRWQYDREHPEGFTIHGFAGSLAYAGLVYTAFSDGYVVALKPATGEPVWTRPLGGKRGRFVDVDVTPVAHDGLLLASSYGSGLHALDPSSGVVKWRFPIRAATAVARSPAGIYVAAPKVGLVALDRNGREKWRQVLPKGVPVKPVPVEGYLFVSTSESGLAVARQRDGHLLQYFAPGSGISAPATRNGDTLAVLSNRGGFYLFDLL